jgi:hypothetical protein
VIEKFGICKAEYNARDYQSATNDSDAVVPAHIHLSVELSPFVLQYG